jgi:D-alanine-D-alanine ligase
MDIRIDPDWWKTLFDETYLLTDARSIGDTEITRREVNVVCELIPIRPDHWILDLCGGQGRHSLELCRRGYKRCTVLDYSHHLVKYGKALASRLGHPVNFVQGDARSAGLASGVFDHVIIMGNSLGYSPGMDADRLILAESYRMLRRGGWLFIDVTDGANARVRFNPSAWHEIGPDIVVCRQRKMNEDSISTREMVISKERGLIRDCTYSIRLYEPESLAALLEDAGFTNIRVCPDFFPHQKEDDYGFMNHRVIFTAQRL